MMRRRSLGSINTRLIGTYLLIAVLALGAGVLSLSQINRINDILVQETTRADARYLSTKIRVSTLQIATLVDSYLTADSATVRTRLATELADEQIVLEEFLNQLGKQVASIEGQELLPEITALGQTYLTQVQAVIDTAGVQEAVKSFESTSVQLQELLTTFEEQQTNLVNASQQGAQETVRGALMITIVLPAAIFVGVFLLAWWVSRTITRPVIDLVTITQRVAAGDLDHPIEVRSETEIGLLAGAFKEMTTRLRDVIEGLEQRVAERTQDVERRALQLQVAAEVAREAASITEMDNLLKRSIALIRDRFNFYFVGVFIIDDLGRYAVLRSGTGEAGRVFLQRELKLRVGETGIIGHVAGTGEPRVVNDVEADFAYQRDPLLPDTRAELVLPLKVGVRNLGVLDVQSNELNAFLPDDVASLQIVADQLAVAIQNARLLEELQGRLREINTLYRRYTQESWAQAAGDETKAGYQYDLSQVLPVERPLPQDVLDRLQFGNTITLSPAEARVGKESATLVAPLMMYDRLIGVIGLEEDDPKHEWSADDIALVEAVASQVALALDNARLLEESQLRADQIRLLQEITATAASHVDLVELLDNVSQRLRAGLELVHCGVALFDPGGRTATLVANASADPFASGVDIIGTKIPLEGNELTQQVIHTHRSAVVYDAQNNPLTASVRDLQVQRGTNTLVIVPLVSRDEVIGTIGLYVADPERRFTDDDLRLLDQISLQISSAIEVARSFEQTQRRAEQEGLVGEITGRMRETLNVDSVLRTAVQEIGDRLGLNDLTIQLEGDGDD